MSEDIEKKTVIVVLGMHRSGTSLVGSIIQSLGISLGDNLIVPDLNNQAGYFEHTEIVRLHAELLDVLDRRWTGPKGTLDYPNEWWRLPAVDSITEQLAEIVSIETVRTEGVWGFKDPRASRLIPLWTRILAEFDIEPTFVLSLRNPLAVAASILHRDAIDPTQSQLLWLLHNLDAVTDSGDRLKCIVDYDCWFTDPNTQLEQLSKSIGIPKVDQSCLNTITSLIQPDLRHNRTIDFGYVPYVEEVFILLKDCSQTGELSDDFWKISDEVQKSKALFQSWGDFIDSTKTSRRRLSSSPGEPPENNLGLMAKIRSKVIKKY